MSVILFAHSLTSVTSLDPSLQPPCLPVSLVYLSVVPSFTSFPNCLPYPPLPSSPPPLFCVCYSVFPGRGTHISRICVPPGGGTHITRDMCFPGGEHISLGICVSQLAECISVGIRVLPGRGTHITRDVCFPGSGNTYHYRYVFPMWGNTYH